MVNVARYWTIAAGALLLVATALMRGAEYDEQYTLFLTAGTPRPAWPSGVFPAGLVGALQMGHGSLTGIAQDLRTTDVHPPLYFWAIALWRELFGPSLLAARLFSVLCGIFSLCLIARLDSFRAVGMTAMTYGFAYTNAIARGFAPAELMTLAGLALIRRPLLAGVAFGVACGCNYLAVFAAVAICTVHRAWKALIGAAPFLLLDAWFFLAQSGGRPDQFPPFQLWPSVRRVIGYQAAAIFGGLPLYWTGAAQLIAAAGVGVATCLVAWRCLCRRNPTLLAAAVAPACGLLVLGVVFNNTPIELRYLSFSLPFIAMLAATPGPGRWVIMTVQAAGIAGLLLAPRTMQPAHDAAFMAAAYAEGAVVLIPAGNDGVGIVGAFGIEAPATLSLHLVRPADPPFAVPAEYNRVILALLCQDRDSIAALPALRASIAGPNWRRIAIGSNVEVYDRTDRGE